MKLQVSQTYREERFLTLTLHTVVVHANTFPESGNITFVLTLKVAQLFKLLV